MSFSELKILSCYDSEDDDILNDFYIPVLKETKEYCRLTGFFSSTSLAIAARGIRGLLENDGLMKIVVGAVLSKEDVEAIKEGKENPKKIIEKFPLEDFNNIEDQIVKNHVRALAWMVANKKLGIRVAIVRDHNGIPMDIQAVSGKGIFHMKVGILIDNDGKMISFSGSVNETARAWKENIEEIKVFRHWIKPEYWHFKSDYDKFNKYWNGKSSRVEIFEIPEALKEKLIKIAPRDIDELDLGNESKYKTTWTKKGPVIPLSIEIRNYQKKAIKKWFEKECNGILKMATGTGKTITALTLIVELYKRCNNRLAIIITCPYKHLVVQWKNNARTFNLKPILGFESRQNWENQLNAKITSFNAKAIDSFSLITTHASFGMDIMQETLSKLRGNAIIIVDEVHHFGAKHLRNCFPNNITFRLGLSATPERWYDNIGNEYINEYFKNGVIYEYTLADAINDKWLTKYYYYTHLIELTENECEKYHELSKKIATIFPKKIDFELSENNVLKNLLIKRARLIGNAENKLSKLEQLMQDKRNSFFNLVYCGDGEIEDERQIDRVIGVIGRKLDMKAHPFTAKENSTERKKLLNLFENQKLQVLVAIRCLDEGVDVPATQTAYILASSTNPRQFIQRRGRILRKHSNKKFSYVHDFIVVPPNLSRVDYLKPKQFNIERKMIKRELKRVKEFAETAVNGPQVDKCLLELKKKYNLLDL